MQMLPTPEYLRQEARRALNEHGNTDFYALLRGAAEAIERLTAQVTGLKAIIDELRTGLK